MIKMNGNGEVITGDSTLHKVQKIALLTTAYIYNADIINPII